MGPSRGLDIDGSQLAVSSQMQRRKGGCTYKGSFQGILITDGTQLAVTFNYLDAHSLGSKMVVGYMTNVCLYIKYSNDWARVLSGI